MSGRLTSLGERLVRAMWRAQAQACPICGVGLCLDEIRHPRLGWTIDHVWPRRRYRGVKHQGNQLVAHHDCNVAKADRDPTGCEQIMLAAVNARMGFKPPRAGPLVQYLDEIDAPSALAIALEAATRERRARHEPN